LFDLISRFHALQMKAALKIIFFLIFVENLWRQMLFGQIANRFQDKVHVPKILHFLINNFQV